MAEGGGGGNGSGGNETGTTSSPKNRVKLLCSHGGKILPRPTDGVLKYVGGETRVVAFPRDINFSELMQKLSTIFDGDLVLKYQLIPEDLDALVSVKSDEDLSHMLYEYDRQEGEGTARLRAFLYPSNPTVVETQSPTNAFQSLEQRYIDAINGVVRATPKALKIVPPRPNLTSFAISTSASSSPNTLSPEKCAHDSGSESVVMNAYQQAPRVTMHKVRSSPSLYNLNNHQQPVENHHHHGGNATVYQHFHQNYQQQHHHQPSYQSSFPTRPPPPLQDLSKVRQVGGSGGNYYSSIRHKGFGNNGNKYVQMEESGAHGVVNKLDRAETIPRNPGKVIWE